MTRSQPDNAASDQATHIEKLRALLAPDFETGGNRREIILIPLAAVFMALVIGTVVMMATSGAPATILRSFVAMADGSVGSINAISETLTASIPLVLAGLGIGLTFRAGLFNIGAEGQMVIGGLAATIASFSLTGLPMAVELCAAFSVGGTWRVA